MWCEVICVWWCIVSGCGSGFGVSEVMVVMVVIGKCWLVYLVRVENGVLYCGISDDLLCCFDIYCSGKGVWFFYFSFVCVLVYVEVCVSKGDVLCCEWVIKVLSKCVKECLLVGVLVLCEVGELVIQDVYLWLWGICGLFEELLVEMLDLLLWL